MKVVIDGNIGSGKTTQLNMLQKHNFQIQKEPIEKWPLELFYSDPERWGFLFQVVVLQTFKPVDTDGLVIYERCPSSSKDVFWTVMKKHPVEDHIYKTEFENYAWFPDVYILLDKPPEMCHQHIQYRTQSGDSGVSLEYLQSLDDAYHNMFENEISCPKYKIDASKSPEEIFEDILNILWKVDVNG